MLNSTTYRWIKTKGWIRKALLGLDNIWFHSPINFLKIHNVNRKDGLLKILFHKYDLVGFFDGSWKKLMQGGTIEGIGGLLYNKEKEKEMIYLFSGPAKADSVFQVEHRVFN